MFTLELPTKYYPIYVVWYHWFGRTIFTYFLIFLHIILNIGHIIWRVFCSICKPTLDRCANFAMIRNVFLQTLRRVKPQVLSIQYFVGISMKFLGTFWNINLQIKDEIRPSIQYLHYSMFYSKHNLRVSMAVLWFHKHTKTSIFLKLDYINIVHLE